MPSIYAAKQIASALVKIGGVGFFTHNIASTLGKVLAFELEQDMAIHPRITVVTIQRQFSIFTLSHEFPARFKNKDLTPIFFYFLRSALRNA